MSSTSTRPYFSNARAAKGLHGSDQHTRVVAQEHVNFLKLQLSPSQFAAYSHHVSADPTRRPPLDANSPYYDGRIARVYGYDDEASRAIVQSNIDVTDYDTRVAAREYLEVGWDSLEQVHHVIRRVEQQLRILHPAWKLAANGLVLCDQDAVLFKHPLFKERPVVDLFLVPNTALADYYAKVPIIHAYKYVSPQPAFSHAPLRTEGEISSALARYHLIAPTPSWPYNWTRYIHARDAADVQLASLVALYDGRPALCPLLEQIRDGATSAIYDGFNREFHLRALSIVDGFMPQDVRVEYYPDDSNGHRPVQDQTSVAAAEVMTRIFSPVKPAVVDIRFVYHDIWGSDGPPTCTLEYRIEDMDMDEDGSDYAEAVPEWRTMFSFDTVSPVVPQTRKIYAEPNPPLRGNAPSLVWYMSPMEVERVHRALFSRHPHPTPVDALDDLYNVISRKDTLRLLLAAGGIIMYVRRFAHDAEDSLDLDGIGGIRWRFGKQTVGWLGDRIRECGIDVDANATGEHDDYSD